MSRLTKAQRFLAYGLAGWCSEVVVDVDPQPRPRRQLAADRYDVRLDAADLWHRGGVCSSRRTRPPASAAGRGGSAALAWTAGIYAGRGGER